MNTTIHDMNIPMSTSGAKCHTREVRMQALLTQLQKTPSFSGRLLTRGNFMVLPVKPEKSHETRLIICKSTFPDRCVQGSKALPKFNATERPTAL